MGVLGIVIILFFVGAFCVLFFSDIFSDISNIFYVGGLLLSLIMGLAILCIIPDIILTRIKFDYIKEEYHNLELQVNTIEYDDIVTGANLRNQVLEMNNKISEHKVYSKNIWVNLWYSEEIGNLKPLEWKSKKKLS